MRVLISGFEPFAGREINPTEKLVDSIKKNEIHYPNEMTLESILLPVRFSNSYELLKNKVEEFNPDIILAFGLASGRSSIELEEIAVNTIQSHIPDNAGIIISNTPINPTGAEFYNSTLPIRGMEAELRKEGLAVNLSNSAGTFVCNYLFYRMMEENQNTRRLCGFIHVPLLPEQVKDQAPSISMEELKKSVSIILNYINYKI
jgi:pyroglutamyl-peptidase